MNKEEGHWHDVVSRDKYIRRRLPVDIPAYRKREGTEHEKGRVVMPVETNGLEDVESEVIEERVF